MRAEQQRAVRALLARPLLTASGSTAEDFVLVRRHDTELRRFFADQVGWMLQVDREMARLRKLPGQLADGSRPARARAKDPAFSPRRYVLLCLALAALERSDRQTTLHRVAEHVAAMVAEDAALRNAGIEFELTGRDQRRDLVAVVRWLLEYGILRRVEGEEEAFVGDRGDVLYQVDRKVLAWVLGCARPPSAMELSGSAPAPSTFDERLDSLVDDVQLESDELRRRALRHTLARRLLDDPIVYYDELSEEEHDYLQRSRVPILKGLTDMTGLIAEVRAEGIALVDPTGDSTDVALPEEGTDGHATLLLAEHLADHARQSPGVTVPLEALHAHARGLVEKYGGGWRKAATESGAEVELTETALLHLGGLGLVVRGPDGVLPRPAIGRYAVHEHANDARPTGA